MLEVGQKPAGFTLLQQDGTPVSWDSLRGQAVVIFCYPRASTPGCTTEACDFRDASAELASLGVQTLGLSADKVPAQKKFADKFSLTYPLLSDPEHVVLEPWGVWGEKVLYGKVSMGIVRTTFWFDASGTLVRRWNKVRVAGHVDDVLAAVRGA